MLQRATWFGISLALHLTIALVLIVVAAHKAERTPKAIMVILDNLESPDLRQQTAPRAPVRAVVHPVAPPTQVATVTARPEALKPEQVLNTPQQDVVQTTVPNRVPDKSHPQETTRAPAEPTTTVATRPPAASSAPQPVRAAITEGGPSPEKVQQRYIKEHFTYIRDLITKQLVYPPLAKRMRWSGKVIVAFTIAEDGTVHGIRVVESSGFPILDKSAAETVRTTAPFPKPPLRAEIIVPINFRMMP